MASKYGAVPVELDGHRFASKAEGNRYLELRLLQAAGEIGPLVVHPRYALYTPVYADTWNGRPDRQPIDADAPPATLRLCDGEYGPYCYAKRIGYYTADFAYVRKDGEAVIEDVKGGRATKTEAYRLRKKIVEAFYGIKVTEVE